MTAKVIPINGVTIDIEPDGDEDDIERDEDDLMDDEEMTTEELAAGNVSLAGKIAGAAPVPAPVPAASAGACAEGADVEDKQEKSEDIDGVSWAGAEVEANHEDVNGKEIEDEESFDIPPPPPPLSPAEANA